MNMRAVFLHVLADALGSVIVIFSAILNIYKTELQLPERLIDCIDPILCLCLVTLILSSTTPLCSSFFNAYIGSKYDIELHLSHFKSERIRSDFAANSAQANWGVEAQRGSGQRNSGSGERSWAAHLEAEWHKDYCHGACDMSHVYWVYEGGRWYQGVLSQEGYSFNDHSAGV